jgi:hypothetical protein
MLPVTRAMIKNLLAMTLFLPVVVHAQQDVPALPRTLFKFSPQHIGLATLLSEVERFNAARSRSYSFGVGVTYQGQFEQPEQTPVRRGFQMGFQYRKYIKPLAIAGKSASQGIYVGGFADAGFNRTRELRGWRPDREDPRRVNHIYSDYETLFFASGFTLGVQRVFWNVLAVDVFAGGGLRLNQIQMVELGERWAMPHQEIYLPEHEGIFPRIGLKVGIAL